MKHTLPWNVTGIPPEARDAARAAAHREGITVGAFLTRLILDGGPQATPAASEEPATILPLPKAESGPAAPLSRPVDFVAEFRRIDEAIRVMAQRIDTGEQMRTEAQRAINAAAEDIHMATREQAQLFQALANRLETVERQADPAALRDAVKGLHQGLGRLAEEIATTAQESAAQVSAVSGNLEGLASKITDARTEARVMANAAGERIAELDARLKASEQSFVTPAQLKRQLNELEVRLENRQMADGSGERIAELDARLKHAEQRVAATDQLKRQLSDIEARLSAAPSTDELEAKLQARISFSEERMQESLEQHLSAIERAIDSLGTRLEQAETREDPAIALQDGIRNLGTRLEGVEKKHREVLSGIETKLESFAAALEGCAKKLEALEARPPQQIVVAGSSFETSLQAEPLFAPPPNEAGPNLNEEDEGELPPFVEELARPRDLSMSEDFRPADSKASDSAQAAASVTDYLTHARRAAQAAAETQPGPVSRRLPGLDELAAEDGRGNLIRRSAKRVVLAVAILAVILAGIQISRTLWQSPKVAALQVAKKPAAARAAAGSIAQLLAQAEAGDPKAALALGLKYAGGEGVAVNDAEAARWVRKAAEAGDVIAQYRLGTFYEKGRGVPADPQQTIRWYTEAAKRGNRKAMHNLAVAYANGLGGKENLTEAAGWFQQAAELGLTDSQFNLAVLYERGLGVKPSLAEAYKWYAIAASQGDSESKIRAEALASQITPAEREAADKIARSYKPQPLNVAANDG